MEMKKLSPNLDCFQFKDIPYIHQTNFLPLPHFSPPSIHHLQPETEKPHCCCCHRVLGFSCSFLISLEEHLETLESFLSSLLNPLSISHTPIHSSGGRKNYNDESFLDLTSCWQSICPATMGLKFSKPGPGPEKVGNVVGLNGHYRLVNYFMRTLYIRHLVSKKRRRMLVGGYDLDMSYITDRVLAMSFPAQRMRAMYRNPLWQVKSVLDMRHSGHYKVYNLCVEESYDPSHFHGRVEMYPFDDNHVPPLSMVKIFCESVHSWLSLDPQNIAVIHCMAGKGRTGLMVCAYLVYSGMSAEEALQLYAQRRTTNNEGVSIASQRRYVGYWSKIRTFPRGVSGPPHVDLPQPCSRELRRVRLYDTVNTNAVYFVVSELQKVSGELYQPSVEVARSCCREVKQGYQRNNSPRYYLSFVGGDEEGKKTEEEEPHVVVQMDTESPAIYQKTCLDYYFDTPLLLTGDVRVIFYQKMMGGRLFYACFNTAFITSSLLQFSLHDLDKVGYKGKSICGSSFCVELLFGPAHTNCQLSLPMEEELSDSLL